MDFSPKWCKKKKELTSCGVGTKDIGWRCGTSLDSGVWLGVWRPLAWSWEKMWHLGEDLDHY